MDNKEFLLVNFFSAQFFNRVAVIVRLSIITLSACCSHSEPDLPKHDSPVRRCCWLWNSVKDEWWMHGFDYSQVAFIAHVHTHTHTNNVFKQKCWLCLSDSSVFASLYLQHNILHRLCTLHICIYIIHVTLIIVINRDSWLSRDCRFTFWFPYTYL